MSSGLFALLDDVAAIAKVAAASLDDVASQTAKVGAKAAGIVIDDAAVTPRYVVGFAADRELPIIGRIAWGSLKNKFLFLLPAALLLSYFAPWIITPLLIAGGLFLCFEGYEKVHGLIHPDPNASKPKPLDNEADAKALEDKKVAGAIRTDMILSAEIMAIALASITAPGLAMKAAVLAAVALSITVLVYGSVALIVKADDFGAALARGTNAVGRAFGAALVRGMPGFLSLLSVVGMLAMLWVGGGIIIHGAHEMGFVWPEKTIKSFAAVVGGFTGPGAGLVGWAVEATIAGVVGLALGFLVALAVAAWPSARSSSAGAH